MSVLIFHKAALATKAAATMLAAKLIEVPSTVFGFEYHPELSGVYHFLTDLSTEGVLDWSEAHAYSLTEYNRLDHPRSALTDMQEKYFRHMNIRPENCFMPPAYADDWNVACNAYEDAILDDGGIDILLIHIGEDGSLAYNYGASELAPITHVERSTEGRVITAGITTILSAKKIVAVMCGEEKADMAKRVFSGPVTPHIPASYLQLHANAVFLLDDAAARYL